MNITNQNAYAILQELEHQANQLDKQVVGSYEHMKCKMLQQEITSAMQVVENDPKVLYQNKDLDTLDVIWTTQDIIDHIKWAYDREISVECARSCLRLMENNHDADIGITWDTINTAYEEVTGVQWNAETNEYEETFVKS